MREQGCSILPRRSQPPSSPDLAVAISTPRYGRTTERVEHTETLNLIASHGEDRGKCSTAAQGARTLPGHAAQRVPSTHKKLL